MIAADRRLDRWLQWLSLSSTPAHHRLDEPGILLEIRGGRIVDPARWPRGRPPRLYVAVDRTGPVYAGQTCDALPVRINRHFGAQTSPDQRLKAGTWVGVATASFPNASAAELNDLERRAARWVVPRRHLVGRRHPRART